MPVITDDLRTHIDGMLDSDVPDAGAPIGLPPSVLSGAALRLALDPAPGDLAGGFSLDEAEASGQLRVTQAATPGVAHLTVTVRYRNGGALRYEADVRESWLSRVAVGARPQEAVLRALEEVARLPQQSTVSVSFDE